jgi:toxin secretion/phage lysis holin
MKEKCKGGNYGMENIEVYIKFFGGLIGIAFSYLFGGWDTALLTLISFIIMDFITGALASEYGLSSQRAWKGFKKKLAYLLAVVFGVLVDNWAGQGGNICRNAVIGILCTVEGMSIIENFGKLGVPLPHKLKQLFEVLRSKEDTNGQNTDTGTSEGTDNTNINN